MPLAATTMAPGTKGWPLAAMPLAPGGARVCCSQCGAETVKPFFNSAMHVWELSQARAAERAGVPQPAMSLRQPRACFWAESGWRLRVAHWR